MRYACTLAFDLEAEDDADAVRAISTVRDRVAELNGIRVGFVACSPQPGYTPPTAPAEEEEPLETLFDPELCDPED